LNHHFIEKTNRYWATIEELEDEQWITQPLLNRLVGLKKLRVEPRIRTLRLTSLVHMTRLQSLEIMDWDDDLSPVWDLRVDYCTGIDDISMLTSLTLLNLGHYTNVNLFGLTNLTTLRLACNIMVDEVPELPQLTSLDLSSNQKITTISHLTTLRSLDLSYNCRILSVDIPQLLS
jgi:Leucine-rich repeat (LRR) protein